MSRAHRGGYGVEFYPDEWGAVIGEWVIVDRQEEQRAPVSVLRDGRPSPRFPVHLKSQLAPQWLEASLAMEVMNQEERDAVTQCDHCDYCGAWAECTSVDGWSMSLGETVETDICETCREEDDDAR